MYYGMPVEDQEQKMMREYLWKKQVDYEQAVAKEKMKNDAHMELAMRKAQLQEYRQEMRRAEYAEVSISREGVVNVQIRNSISDLPERKLTNFLFCEIFSLESADGEEGYYDLYLLVGEVFRNVILDGSQIGKTSYFKRKLLEIGARILTQKKSDEERYLNAFWECLSLQCDKKRVIPVHKGWIIDENGCVKFVREGDILWDRILKQAK